MVGFATDALLLAAQLCLAVAPGNPSSLLVTVRADAKRIGMGRSVTVTATVRQPDGHPAPGTWLLPYVDGLRWGPHEVADAQGEAVFHLPLAYVGDRRIQVAAVAPLPKPTDSWAWGGLVVDHQTVYLQREFTLMSSPKSAELWLAADDEATVWLNGRQIDHAGGWDREKPTRVPAEALKAGRNLVSVEAINGIGPAGVALRLDVTTADGAVSVATDDSWRSSKTKPDGWPAETMTKSESAVVQRRIDEGSPAPAAWPGTNAMDLIAGTPLRDGAVVSTPVTVKVVKRELTSPGTDPDHVLGVQWEQWFTPHNIYWQVAQCVPVMGFYNSYLPEVARQHLIWFIESGMDCIVVDWSNNIWHSKTWDPGVGPTELFQTTHVMLDEMAKMRDEGYKVPTMTFLTGVDYEPEGVDVVNRQLDFIYKDYVSNPRYRGLWQYFEGKPLILALDLPLEFFHKKAKLDERFTVRYEVSQQDVTGQHKLGTWSWMDFQTPMLTVKDGKPEGMTVSCGCFGPGGWLSKAARGRRNGATWIEDWKHAFESRPAFVQVHQFQEFAGQAEGEPVRPSPAPGEPPVYVDVYSPELSDDFEPTSLTAHAYRGEGGWGYFYLNLLRAIVDIYRHPEVGGTVAAFSTPLQNSVNGGNSLHVEWVVAGAPAKAWRIELNGKPMATVTNATSADIDLRDVKDGPATLKLVGIGTKTRYVVAWTTDAQPLKSPIPYSVELPIVIKRVAN